jgi:AraC family transcriptional activator of pobA
MAERNFLEIHSFLNGKDDIKSIKNDFCVFSYEKDIIPPYPIKNDMYVCCIVTRGEARGRINLLPCTLKSQAMCITMPGYILEHEYMSDDFQCICIMLSERFLSGLGLSYDFQTHLFIQENPILNLTDEHFTPIISYCNMVRNILGSRNPYKKETVKHLTCAFFYGLGYYFYEKAENRKLTNDEILMQKFLKEVQQFYKQERKVIFYANKLCLSAGYLSTLIKKVSGRTVADWIDDYVILEAKALLKSGKLTIQQISDELNFPSQSFFGKYFKRIVGVSPNEYKKD